jgi:hypothetical protein
VSGRSSLSNVTSAVRQLTAIQEHQTPVVALAWRSSTKLGDPARLLRYDGTIGGAGTKAVGPNLELHTVEIRRDPDDYPVVLRLWGDDAPLPGGPSSAPVLFALFAKPAVERRPVVAADDPVDKALGARAALYSDSPTTFDP